jgi:hypothetical protein
MKLKDHLKAFWRRYVGGGLLGIVVAAIMATQPDVPVLQSPVVKWRSNTDIELLQPYAVTTTAGIVTMAEGFRSDGASEPPAAWTVLGLHPFSGATIRAALTHDAMIRAELRDAETCNRVFYEILIQDGVQADKALCMYEAVCRASDAVWARHTTESVSEALRYVTITER